MSKKIEGYNCTSQWIELGCIHIHPIVQRGFKKALEKMILEGFDVNALRPLLVVPIPNRPGHYWVWDGQHRHTVLCEKFPLTSTVQCSVYTGLSVSKLAELQELFNKGTSSWTQLERFSNLLTAKDKTALEIKRLVDSFDGLKVSTITSRDGIKAVSALRAIYDKEGMGEPVLSRTLAVLHGAWACDWDAYHSAILNGTAMMMLKHPDLDISNLATKLRKDGTASMFIGRARGSAKAARVSLAVGVAVLMVNSYNVRRQNRLPAFHN